MDPVLPAAPAAPAPAPAPVEAAPAMPPAPPAEEMPVAPPEPAHEEAPPAAETYAGLSALAAENPFAAGFGALLALVAGGVVWKRKQKAKKAKR